MALAITLGLCLIHPTLLSETLALFRQPIGIVLSSLMFFYYLFAVRAFQLAPVSDVALIIGLSPMIGLTVKVFLKQALALAEALGASLAFCGLVLFVTPKVQGAVGNRTAYLVGLLFAFLAACVSLGYAALFKQHSRKASLSPIAVSGATFILGAAVTIPTAIATSPELIPKLMQPKSAVIALSLGVISTVIPTFCYSYAAKYLSPVLTTTLNLLVPIFAAVVAFVGLEETIPPIGIIGTILIIIGIITLTTAKPKAVA